MAGDVDDVVGAGHDEDVAVLVDVAGIGGLVVAGKGVEVRLAEALVRVPERRRGAGRHRQLDHERADLARRELVTARRPARGRPNPAPARVGEPGTTGSRSMPRQLAAIGQPVSVCHQWSITGTPSFSSAQPSVSGSQRSPARKSARKPREVVAADVRCPRGPAGGSRGTRSAR